MLIGGGLLYFPHNFPHNFQIFSAQHQKACVYKNVFFLFKIANLYNHSNEYDNSKIWVLSNSKIW